MRLNIEISDELIREALRISGLKTKRAVVEAGLKALIRRGTQTKILDSLREPCRPEFRSDGNVLGPQTL